MPKEATTVLFSAEERVLVDTDFISLVSCEHAQLDLCWAGTAFSSSMCCCSERHTDRYAACGAVALQMLTADSAPAAGARQGQRWTKHTAP